jgi:hypothetical protein
MTQKFSTRIGNHWLLLSHVRGSLWNLQVLGDTPLEAEVSAENEMDAKETSLSAAFERLRSDQPSLRIPSGAVWSDVFQTRWSKRSL